VIDRSLASARDMSVAVNGGLKHALSVVYGMTSHDVACTLQV